MISSTGSPSSMSSRSSATCSSRADRQHRQRDRAPASAAGAGAATRCARVGPGVVQRQVEREGAALPVHAGQPDLAAEQRGQLAADRQAEAGAAVLARGAGVGLLEGLEDEPLLLRRDADAGVLDRERDHLLRAGCSTGWSALQPAVARRDAHVDVALRGELDGVRQQVLQDLLQPLRVAVHRRAAGRRSKSTWNGRFLASATWRKLRSTLSRRPANGDLLDLDRHRAGLDLRQVEDVVDQVQQVGAGRVDVAGELDLLGGQVAGARSRPAAGSRIRIELSGVRSSCDMLARNSDLYFEVSASSAAFSSSARRACSTSRFLRSTSAFCSASSLRLRCRAPRWSAAARSAASAARP